MKRRTRFVCLFLVLCLIAVSFAACAGGQEQSPPSSETGTAAPADASPESAESPAAPAEGETTTIQFMGFSEGPLEADSMSKNMSTFMERNPNIKVEYTPSEFSVYHQKLLTMIAGNSAPDIFYVGLSYYVSFARRGVLMDITDRFNQEYAADDFIPAAIQMMTVDDRYYGISAYTTSPILYFNTARFDEEGIPYPSSNPDEPMSWDEFVDVAKKLTKVEADGTV